jgi:leucyl aminopeptidase
MKKHLVTLFPLFLTSTAFAVSAPHTIIAPTCLSSHAALTVLAKQSGFVLANADDQAIEQLIEAKTQQKTRCGGFKDVTAAWHEDSAKNPAAFLKRDITPAPRLVTTASYDIQHEKEVNALLTQVNPQNILDSLTAYTQFEDRYANDQHGVAASEWIKNKALTIASDNHRDDVSVTVIPTDNYMQPSIMIKVGDSNEAGVVLGAHMDTLKSSWFGNKPGADDDGSGSMSLFETYRTIMASGMHFKHPLYFIWYAAEEEGTIGSQFVVEYVQKNNIPVMSVMQMDMTGYTYQNDPSIYFMTDNVSRELTDYFEKLVSTYVQVPFKESECGYACSDHASWDAKGYPAVMPFEAAMEHMNPNIHKSVDTIDKLSLKHMSDFSKLGVAYAVEMAEPV